MSSAVPPLGSRRLGLRRPVTPRPVQTASSLDLDPACGVSCRMWSPHCDSTTCAMACRRWRAAGTARRHTSIQPKAKKPCTVVSRCHQCLPCTPATAPPTPGAIVLQDSHSRVNEWRRSTADGEGVPRHWPPLRHPAPPAQERPSHRRAIGPARCHRCAPSTARATQQTVWRPPTPQSRREP